MIKLSEAAAKEIAAVHAGRDDKSGFERRDR